MLEALPEPVQGKSKAGLSEIWMIEAKVQV
jgi:hypothetical protein